MFGGREMFKVSNYWILILSGPPGDTQDTSGIRSQNFLHSHSALYTFLTIQHWSERISIARLNRCLLSTFIGLYWRCTGGTKCNVQTFKANILCFRKLILLFWTEATDKRCCALVSSCIIWSLLHSVYSKCFNNLNTIVLKVSCIFVFLWKAICHYSLFWSMKLNSSHKVQKVDCTGRQCQ